MNTVFEDKKCRLCGHADMGNEHIFHTRDRFLVKKIAAVFSIWVTPADPLPKCICTKCFGKVTATYKSYSQVKKLQTKWLENVAAQEPCNNYIQVLNFVERANMSIKNFIETNYGEKLCKDVIENLLINALSGIHENTTGTVVQNSHEQTNANDENLSNGKIDTYETSAVEPEAQASEFDDDEENLSLAKIATNKKLKLTPTPQEPVEVKCKYCPLKFESLKQLAEHQVVHLRLSTIKLFQPKYLDKNFRRGRLISVQSRQSIRCLNCYLVFDDNKCILEHWSKAECDFYCQICGEEFAQSPKLLREHVSEVHGISYRSLKMQRDLSFLSISSQQPVINKLKNKIVSKSNKQKTVLQNQPTHMEVSSSTTLLHRSPERPIKCRICNRDFRNFKACNSHMRAHKPPYAYNDADQLPELPDAYMEPEPVNFETTPPPLTPKPPINLPPACSSTASAPLNSMSVVHKDDTVCIKSPASTSTAYFNSDISLKNPLSEGIKRTEPVDMELETIQVNSSTTNFNNNTNNNCHSSDIVTNLPSSSPTSSKPATSTAPRGIRMKFVNRRSDLNSSSAAIKVKSINDLKANQSLPKHHPQHASPCEPKPIINIPTCPPQRLPSNELVPIQTTATCPPSSFVCGNLQSIQNVPTCPPPTPQYTSVIVNSPQNQPTSSLNSFEPLIHNVALMSTSIKDEPMEFI